MPLGVELAARSGLPNRMRKGLWGAKTMFLRNKITEFEHKLRLVRRPNVVRVNLFSEALDRSLRLPVTTTVLRCARRACRPLPPVIAPALRAQSICFPPPSQASPPPPNPSNFKPSHQPSQTTPKLAQTTHDTGTSWRRSAPTSTRRRSRTA